MPTAAARVHDRQPRFAFRIESARRYRRQLPDRRFLPIFPVDFEQQFDGRSVRRRQWRSRPPDRTAPVEHGGERCANRLRPAAADARHFFEAAVLAGEFERFKGLDMQRVVDLAREIRADARYRLEQPFGISVATQPLQLSPPSGNQHFRDRRRNTATDARQRLEPLTPLLVEDVTDGLWELRDNVGRLAICAGAEAVCSLRQQQVCGVAQLHGDQLVVPAEAGPVLLRLFCLLL